MIDEEAKTAERGMDPVSGCGQKRFRRTAISCSFAVTCIELFGCTFSVLAYLNR
jgi:hypothetical protein